MHVNDCIVKFGFCCRGSMIKLMSVQFNIKITLKLFFLYKKREMLVCEYASIAMV